MLPSPEVERTLAATAPLLVAVIGFFARRRLNDIHVLVNSRLTEALAEIHDLKAELKEEKGKNGAR